ncbi:hypothetical protein CMV_005161 [Castanea mollissima]|uniref:Uncharacterized protein n=1 Tax=Castanea mollissima TaxID=60419 RepID=A0A8J4RRI5_9ROSI|nr:hypothetical protein CMV_005161 [Castanea mollissima]
MTTTQKYYSFFVIFVLLNSIFIATEARPLNFMYSRGTAFGGSGGFFDGLSLGAMKESGPSPGEGHKFTNSETLGGIKQSVPSPGVEARPFNILKAHNHHHRHHVGIGNKGFFDGLYLGAMKQSGPSPGQGNKFTDAQTLGDVKDGPSPGQGH